MRILGFNGSPRKRWNTARLLEAALAGAAEAGAETELIQLYDLDFKGCISCFSCKRIGGRSYGRCAVEDGLSPILEKVEEADGLILGSPVYLGAESGRMRQFLERLIFPYLRYSVGDRSLFPRKIKTGLIYTMNVKEEALADFGWDKVFDNTKRMIEMVFGPAELLLSTDTLQFKDYSLYDVTSFDPKHKRRRYQEVFPRDLEKARELGGRIAAA